MSAQAGFSGGKRGLTLPRHDVPGIHRLHTAGFGMWLLNVLLEFGRHGAWRGKALQDVHHSVLYSALVWVVAALMQACCKYDSQALIEWQ